MSWICHEPKFIFIHNPRCAGTSIIQSLAGTCPLTSYAGRCDPGGEPLPAYYVKDHSIAIPQECKHYPVVACVRNPYERELSYYLWNRRHPESSHPVHVAAAALSFERYLEFLLNRWPYESFTKRMFGTQSEFLEGVEVTNLLRFELLPLSFPDLTMKLCGKQVPLTRSPDTSSSSYCPESLYTLRALRLVRKYAERDFALYGYNPGDMP